MNASYVNIVQCHNNGGIIINREGNDLFIKDKDSEVYYLLCDDVDKALKWLKEYGKCYCLELYNEELFDMLKNRYRHNMVCYQYVYNYPDIETDNCLNYIVAEKGDINFFKQHYSNLTDEEIEYIIEHRQLYFGLLNDEIVGFVGMHVEKCVGILKVFEKYRHNGYGKALESFMIKECLSRGLLAYTQVETDNKASIALQESIGLIRGSKLVYLLFGQL